MSKRILVIDDEQILRSLLQELLEEEAYEVDTASNGLIAWKKLAQQSGNYEVIILDMNMPGMNGLQLIQALRSRQEGFLDSIIVMSSDNEAIHKALGMGIRHAMKKPFDMEGILTLVSSCLLELETSAIVS